MDRGEIERLIPHRAPFLWIDRVREIDERRIVAEKRFDPELDVFRGHYPHFPVLPGVLVCEAAFQAGAVLIARAAPPGGSSVPVVTRLNNVQFRQMVRPGDMLEVEVELTERLGAAYFLKAKATVAGRTAARLEFACAMTSIE